MITLKLQGAIIKSMYKRSFQTVNFFFGYAFNYTVIFVFRLNLGVFHQVPASLQREHEETCGLRHGEEHRPGQRPCVLRVSATSTHV